MPEHFPPPNRPPYEHTDADGERWFSDGENWFADRNCCHHCEDERRAQGQPFRWADPRTSFGAYAGRYCDTCWPQSGFRDAVDPTARFDPADAGESLEPV